MIASTKTAVIVHVDDRSWFLHHTLRKISALAHSLVGFYFEVSAFLKLVSIFVPAEGRAGIPRRLTLQVQLLPFHQRLAANHPQLRSRGWPERDKRPTDRGAEKGLHY